MALANPKPARRKTADPDASLEPATSWTFLTNHAHVLIDISERPEVRMRDIATRVGITERAVQRIVRDLEESGHLTRSKDGRCNRYSVNADRPLRHPIEKHRSIQDLLDMVFDLPASARPRKRER